MWIPVSINWNFGWKNGMTYDIEIFIPKTFLLGSRKLFNLKLHDWLSVKLVKKFKFFAFTFFSSSLGAKNVYEH